MNDINKKFCLTVDEDGDREGPVHENKAKAIEWARNNVNDFYNKKAFVMEAVTVITPAPIPAQVVDI